MSTPGMADTGLPAIYNPFSDPMSFAEYVISETEAGFRGTFGTPTFADQQDLGASVAAAAARAGASPEQQQAAAAEAMGQMNPGGISPSTVAFDENSPYSNPLQRGFDAATGTTKWSDVVPQLTNFLNPADWLDVSNASSTLGIVLIVAGLLVGFLILKEVL